MVITVNTDLKELTLISDVTFKEFKDFVLGKGYEDYTIRAITVSNPPLIIDNPLPRVSDKSQ